MDFSGIPNGQVSFIQKSQITILYDNFSMALAIELFPEKVPNRWDGWGHEISSGYIEKI